MLVLDVIYENNFQSRAVFQCGSFSVNPYNCNMGREISNLLIKLRKNLIIRLQTKTPILIGIFLSKTLVNQNLIKPKMIPNQY